MNSQTFQPQESLSNNESEVRTLYQQLLAGWNKRNAYEFAALFAEDGHVIGFDGSQYNGRAEIEAEIGQIFADHPTAAYVGKIREVRFLSPEVAVLRAVAGMVPPGQSALTRPSIRYRRSWSGSMRAGGASPSFRIPRLSFTADRSWSNN